MPATKVLLIVTGIVLAFGLGFVLGDSNADFDEPGGATPPATVKKLEDDFEQLRLENEALRQENESLKAAAAAPPVMPEPVADAPDQMEPEPPTDAEREKAKLALADIEYRLSADPTNPNLLAEYLKTAYQAGETDRALARIKAIAEKFPENADVGTMVGRAYLTKASTMELSVEKGRLAFAAIDEFSKALKNDETHYDARWLRAVVSFHMPPFMNKLSDSISDLEMMVEQSGGQGGDTRYARVYSLLGQAYEKAGRTEEAEKTVDRGLELFPGDKRLSGMKKTPRGE